MDTTTKGRTMTAKEAAAAIRATDNQTTRHQIFTGYTMNSDRCYLQSRAWEIRCTKLWNLGISTAGDQIVAR